ncbi:MAG: DEAD/DEAH box helicase [Treponema sp.]|jgi:superfamily II DNA or RNA helicase|nr:DEAD/DEAH box helicase [Treponema sp.]
MTTLRDYQSAPVDALCSKLFREQKRSVVLQIPTGGGKTVIASAIIKAIQDNKKRSWFIVPRKELVIQTKAHFEKWGISFGIIDASHKESRAYRAHIISLQTLIRRLDKIKEWPDICFIDEAHLNYDSQLKIKKTLPEKTKLVGLTATPGRMDNRGLAALYDDLIEGQSIPYLTQCGYLSPLVYYAPPTDGIQALKFRSTGEVDNNELDKLLTDRAIYGRAVDYYSRLAKLPGGSFRRGVGFCAGVKAAEKQAAEFRSRGFRAEYVDGSMSSKKQRALIDGLAEGRLQVLCSADLLLYGWDSPKVSYGFLLRRTKSKALYFQIVGRILRIADGKPDAIFVDHTGTVDLHTESAYPGVPPLYLDHVNWNFHSKGKEKEKSAPLIDVRLCPYDNYRYCDKKIRCPQCEKYIPNNSEEKIIDSIPLQERIAAMTPHIITPAEKREYQDGVAPCVQAAREADNDAAYDKAVKELCEIAKKLEYRTLWVYWQIAESRHTVDDRAIFSIARVCGYKSGWCYFTKKEIRNQIEQGTRESA